MLEIRDEAATGQEQAGLLCIIIIIIIISRSNLQQADFSTTLDDPVCGYSTKERSSELTSCAE